ncbi:MAG: methyltransferase [Symploca sp. SIO2E9]|nr:methyltransferase [Symploca sp. SIO2E9]
MRLHQMITATWVAQSIYVAASLGIADLLKDRPKSVEALARETSSHEQNLYRVLRALASVEIFVEVAPREFALTEMAQYLRSDVPGSLRYTSMMLSDYWHWSSWGDILYVIKTGEPPMKHLHNVDETFDYLTKNPESGEIFNNAMTAWSKIVHTAVVEAYDFSGIKHIVDIAGGHGTLIAAILAANSHLQGTLFDLPHVVENADLILIKEGVADRCNTLGGSFFETVPEGADAYIMSHIVHDWGDENCIRFLKNIHQSIAKEGKLLIVEMVVPLANEPHFGKLMDICMMIMYRAGKERTVDEYHELLAAAGFKMTRIIPTASPISVIEAVCV